MIAAVSGSKCAPIRVALRGENYFCFIWWLSWLKYLVVFSFMLYHEYLRSPLGKKTAQISFLAQSLKMAPFICMCVWCAGCAVLVARGSCRCPCPSTASFCLYPGVQLHLFTVEIQRSWFFLAHVDLVYCILLPLQNSTGEDRDLPGALLWAYRG